MTRKRIIIIAVSAALMIASVALGIWAIKAEENKYVTVKARDPITVVSDETVPESDTTAPDSRTVYVTPYGQCYHRAGCGHLLDNGRPVSYDEAVARGLRPCEHCTP